MEKVPHVASDCGGDMSFQIFLGLVFRILFELVGDVPMNWLATLGGRDEVVPEDANFQRPLVAVERGGPGILGIDRFPPASVLPDHVYIVERERRCLSIRDIRLAFLVFENTAGR